MSTSPIRVGLSLSGGGYRAAAFHLGTLNKLQQMGILNHVDVMSTISGGSITGAYYCLEKEDYDVFKQKLYDRLQHKDVIKRVLLSFTFFKALFFLLLFLVPAFYFLFTPYAWLFPLLLTGLIILLLKYQFIIFPVSKRIEIIYDDYFFDKRKLGQLPEKPVLVIGSTNLQTSRSFSFSKHWMQDSTYQYMENTVKFNSREFPISRAVMASSCVPFAFTPIKIDSQFFRNSDDAVRIHPLLVDGGVYDNQGIHKIMHGGQYKCDQIITSDAGGGTSGEFTFRNTISLLVTTMNVFMSRIKKAQMIRDIYENTETNGKQLAYFSLAWDVENCIPGFINNLESKQISTLVIAEHQLKQEWVDKPREYAEDIRNYLETKTGYKDIYKPTFEEREMARKVGTNLTALSPEKMDSLMKQASCLTELQVKLYCPSLLKYAK